MLTPYPAALAEMMELFKTLPGVGKRSAERMVLSVLKWDESKLSAMADVFQHLKERIGTCSICGNLAERSSSDTEPLCPFCASPDRDVTSLCVVEDALQIRAIEAGGVFHGVYHVLGGRLAPLEGKDAGQLSIDRLEERLDEGVIKEVILALSPDMEGQATAFYLANRLKDRALKISRPARGLPAGSDLTYVDPATIAAALNGRTDFSSN